MPKSCRSAFEAEWRQREKDMEKFAGFVDFRLVSDGENFIISSRQVTRCQLSTVIRMIKKY